MRPLGVRATCGQCLGKARTPSEAGLLGDGMRHGVRAFSLIDVLVTIAVVALLIGVMLPGVNQARETTRRIVCASNVRQLGLGVAMYADNSQNRIPYTVFARQGHAVEENDLGETLVLRVEGFSESEDSAPVDFWDGLGLLFEGDYLPAPPVFYCPSHSGDHPFSRYARRWQNDGGEIVGNYQYRGVGPNGATRLFQIEPARSALVADGMRTQLDYSHQRGMNVLRADLAIVWYSDVAGVLRNSLPMEESDASSTAMQNAWRQIDRQTAGLDAAGPE